MRQWKIYPGRASDPLVLEDVDADAPSKELGPGDVRIQVRAASLNFRDLLLLGGTYPGADEPVVPLSDGAGEVLAVGPGVTRVAVGDRVTATTVSNWIDGAIDRSSRAGHLGFFAPGWLAEEIVLPDTALVTLPDTMTYPSAATLPCAGVTAWNAIVEIARIGPGGRVLTLGTGGVSMFAVQITKLLGAQVLVTSSSDAKIDRVRALGADEGINYRTEPEWADRVRALTNGEGVDLVIENAGTLGQSLKSTRFGGMVVVIGALSVLAPGAAPAAASADAGLMSVFRSGVTVKSIVMGNRRMLERLVRAYVMNGVEPVIDRTFAFDDSPAAFEALAAAKHVGKMVITV